MEDFDPAALAREYAARRDYGQNFLVNPEFADYEAGLAAGKNVVEFGPGLGMLTYRLCNSAKTVLAVEKDRRLFGILSSSLSRPNLQIINSDFFSLDEKELSGYGLVMGNIPYNKSSKLVISLVRSGKEAIICVQKEFAEHLLAEAGTAKYSRISVLASVYLNIKILKGIIPQSYFFPEPRVASSLIRISWHRRPGIEMELLSAIMSHKRKTLGNALIDSAKDLGVSHSRITAALRTCKIANERPFMMDSKDLFNTALEISEILAGKG